MPYRSTGTSGQHAPTVGAHSAAAARVDNDAGTTLAASPSTRLHLLQSLQHLIPTLSGRFAGDIGALIDAVDDGTPAGTARHGTLTFELQRCRHTLSDIQRMLAAMAHLDSSPADPETSHPLAPKDQRALKDACDVALGQVAQLCRLSDAHARHADGDIDTVPAWSTGVAVTASLMLALRTASADAPMLPGIGVAAVALRVGMAELGVGTLLCDGGALAEPYAGYEDHRQQLDGMLQSARQRLCEQELGAVRNPDAMERISGTAGVVRCNIDAMNAEQRQYAFDAVAGADGELGPTVHALFLNQPAPAPASAAPPLIAIKPGSAP